MYNDFSASTIKRSTQRKQFFFVTINLLQEMPLGHDQQTVTYIARYWPRSDGMVPEEFGWFGGILEEFVREKHCFR